MKMISENINGYQVVTLHGCMDVETVQELRSDFDTLAVNAQSDVVFDMTDVNFMDSSGVGALVFTFKRLKAKRLSLHMVGLCNQPLKLVRLLRIDQSIPAHASIDDLTGLSGATLQGS
ncbi:STAS domain-containing protein [Reinekea marinisedimentorum]|uniref:Anti-sigma factor antagonist n=1 Tax=Reinekea marinisedimentorum TaxID=230495 RepID=A0A4V2UK19_9GAMM|nr:STAS domain-containing protein [Reinekea marinisedimentorum]TCS42386.1 anti-anti-sigma factor [Reinekea marinisedimentorum]